MAKAVALRRMANKGKDLCRLTWRQVMSDMIMVDYALADAWKQRAKAAMRAERLARRVTKVALSAVKEDDIVASQLAEKARLANEAAAQASREAEKVWADTAAVVRGE